MTYLEAIEALDDLQYGDNEAVHVEAERILLTFMKDTGAAMVALAYERARDRCGFWYA